MTRSNYVWMAKQAINGMPVEITHEARTAQDLANKLGICKATVFNIYYHKKKKPTYKIKVYKLLDGVPVLPGDSQPVVGSDNGGVVCGV